MSTPEADTPVRAANQTGRRIIIYAIALLAAFLVGFLPMWIVARGRAIDRDTAQRELRLCRLENNLSAAAIESRRGEYERARVAASSFFTSLRDQVDLSQPGDLTAAQKESLGPLLKERDDLITLLARSDPAAADRLAEVYVSFRKGLGLEP